MKHDCYCNYHWVGPKQVEYLSGMKVPEQHTCELKKNHKVKHKCWCGNRHV